MASKQTANCQTAGNTEGIIKVRNALLSVYYKTPEFFTLAQNLRACDVKLYSSGGTATKLAEQGLQVTDVADYTGSPSMLGHRVVTLHPKVHGGILYKRGDERDETEAAKHGIIPFDLVVVNFYPVWEAIGREGAALDEVVEQTDIGGPTMARAAAKNHKYVAVVVDQNDYTRVGNAILAHGGLTHIERIELATKVFELTEKYDGAIARFYRTQLKKQLIQHGAAGQAGGN